MSEKIRTDLIGIAFLDRVQFEAETKALKKKKQKEKEKQKKQRQKEEEENKEEAEEEDEEDEDSQEIDKIEQQQPNICIACCAGALLLLYNKVKRTLSDRWYFNQRFIHCEIAFLKERREESEDLTCIAFTAIEEDGIKRLNRTFSSDAYTWVFLKTTSEQTLKAYYFCKSRIGQRYDVVGVQRSKLWPSFDNPLETKKWWCSEFVIFALHAAELLTCVNAQTTEIDDLWLLLKHHPTYNPGGMTPFRLNVAATNFRQGSSSPLMNGGNALTKYKNAKKPKKIK